MPLPIVPAPITPKTSLMSYARLRRSMCGKAMPFRRRTYVLLARLRLGNCLLQPISPIHQRLRAAHGCLQFVLARCRCLAIVEFDPPFAAQEPERIDAQRRANRNINQRNECDEHSQGFRPSLRFSQTITDDD